MTSVVAIKWLFVIFITVQWLVDHAFTYKSRNIYIYIYIYYTYVYIYIYNIIVYIIVFLLLYYCLYYYLLYFYLYYLYLYLYLYLFVCIYIYIWQTCSIALSTVGFDTVNSTISVCFFHDTTISFNIQGKWVLSASRLHTLSICEACCWLVWCILELHHRMYLISISV